RHNTLQQQVASLERSVHALSEHTEDLENRSRRNNIRIRNIPESYTDLRKLLDLLFTKLLPEYATELLLIDRVHRSLRPKPQHGEPPRDVVVRLHYFETKEDLLRSARTHKAVEIDGESIQMYQDLSPVTLQKRRDLRPITSSLTRAGYKYGWGFPFHLTVVKNGVLYTLTDPTDGEAFLAKLGLPDSPSPPKLAKTKVTPLQPIWEKVTTKHNTSNKASQQQGSPKHYSQALG
uniref:L1 transposable element RRM domain-containing protein n=1 Tax=Xenopus tropicalis TaxID=8364 RepID=A0A803JBS4_XENTR